MKRKIGDIACESDDESIKEEESDSSQNDVKEEDESEDEKLKPKIEVKNEEEDEFKPNVNNKRHNIVSVESAAGGHLENSKHVKLSTGEA